MLWRKSYLLCILSGSQIWQPMHEYGAFYLHPTDADTSTLVNASAKAADVDLKLSRQKCLVHKQLIYVIIFSRMVYLLRQLQS